ncbi:hypothetical protein Salat_1663700 [Sesamum alatum]|uniref:DUF4283 domain-containing protein n=1 Tax=Sesamum alatum TaxID=300844 RepID=A0AAE2CJQ7_9LAMI|nr:hypothetical protein Salat_1663700 [Sesamum alatum]
MEMDCLRLDFVLSLTKEEAAGVCIPQSAWNKGYGDYSLTLVGRLLLHRSVLFEELKTRLVDLFQAVRGVSIRKVSDSRSCLTFNHPEDLRRILELRPWIFDKNLIVLQLFPQKKNPLLIRWLEILRGLTLTLPMFGGPPVAGSGAAGSRRCPGIFGDFCHMHGDACVPPPAAVPDSGPLVRGLPDGHGLGGLVQHALGKTPICIESQLERGDFTRPPRFPLGPVNSGGTVTTASPDRLSVSAEGGVAYLELIDVPLVDQIRDSCKGAEFNRAVSGIGVQGRERRRGRGSRDGGGCGSGLCGDVGRGMKRILASSFSLASSSRPSKRC